jgi:hypothetical protein
LNIDVTQPSPDATFDAPLAAARIAMNGADNREQDMAPETHRTAKGVGNITLSEKSTH